jgi:hypothetical protein
VAFTARETAVAVTLSGTSAMMKKIVAAIGIIKGFESAPEGLYHLCHRFAPFRPTLA